MLTSLSSVSSWVRGPFIYGSVCCELWYKDHLLKSSLHYGHLHELCEDSWLKCTYSVVFKIKSDCVTRCQQILTYFARYVDISLVNFLSVSLEIMNFIFNVYWYINVTFCSSAQFLICHRWLGGCVWPCIFLVRSQRNGTFVLMCHTPWTTVQKDVHLHCTLYRFLYMRKILRRKQE